MYAAWTLVWGALAMGPVSADVERSTLPRGCAFFGLVVIVGCLLARRRFSRCLARVRE